MSKDNIIKLIQPTNVEDQLTEILRTGARSLLAKAVEAEVADFLDKRTDLKTSDGHQRVVRHGHLPEREVMTGIGPVAVRQPRLRDRRLLIGVRRAPCCLINRGEASNLIHCRELRGGEVRTSGKIAGWPAQITDRSHASNSRHFAAAAPKRC